MHDVLTQNLYEMQYEVFRGHPYIGHVSTNTVEWLPWQSVKITTPHLLVLLFLMPPERSSHGPEVKRKPRLSHAPYKPRKPNGATDNPGNAKSSAKHLPAPEGEQRSNLTLHDWLMVFAFIDTHPDMSQDAIVEHFKGHHNGALIFTQSTLSQKIRDRKKLEARVNEFPNALSSKRPRIVTRPDVDQALFLWVKHMEVKKESVNGAMLVAKRTKFEEQFNVPDEECLKGDRWIDSFKRAYGIQEYRRHGEAASVDIAAVEAEQTRLKPILGKYHPKDRFNFDETSFFALQVFLID